MWELISQMITVGNSNYNKNNNNNKQQENVQR